MKPAVKPWPAEYLRDLLTLVSGNADLGEECLLWPYATAGTLGYAVVGRNGKLRKVSHLVLEAAGYPRPVPPRHHALHSCDTPACVNPAHLRWGTHSENMRDRAARTGWKRTR